jgi:putative heme-binding domain-containing protein
VEWKHVVVTDPAGVLGLAMPANSVTYLNTTYDAGTGGAAVLTAGSDDGLQVWLNGKRVIANDANRPTKADQDRAVVQLVAGTNVLLLRVNNNAGDAGVQARVRQQATDFEPGELEQIAKDIPGDAKRGRGVFERAGCVKCHATDGNEEPKGPFLGDAGVKFQRGHVIESILRPSAKIAQGFDTVRVTAKADGGGTTEYVGWVTKEGSDLVTMRDAAGRVYEVQKAKIVKRETLPQSMMPEGLMRGVTLEDFSSLMAYVGSLNGKP